MAELHLSAHPELAQRFGAIARKRCMEDAEYHIRYLAQALRFGAPSLFIAYTNWAREMLEARRVGWDDLAKNLEILRDELARDAGPEAEAIREHVDAALAAPVSPAESFLTASRQAALANAYVTALLRAERRTAVSTVEAAMRAGLSIRDFYLEVAQPVQREIGRLWQLNRITVAEEHYCTASTQALMAQFYPQILSTPRVGRKIVVACVGNELHEIGVRMVADFFEMAGWDGIYLGANTPEQALVDLVCRERPHAVALGVTMTYHLGSLQELVRHLRDEFRSGDVKIIVGGYVFHQREDLWRFIGADSSARDAEEAVRVAERLLNGRN
ncbi:MAG TPA: cobalamin-dependent protein [Thermoanaerobaculia bacterium]